VIAFPPVLSRTIVHGKLKIVADIDLLFLSADPSSRLFADGVTSHKEKGGRTSEFINS
jgi:hypothetical protein